ncbi:MAG: hypothetical protein AB1540_05345 [Bdellovibrionota bacterium]
MLKVRASWMMALSLAGMCFSATESMGAANDPLCRYYRQYFPKLYRIACGSNPKKSKPAGASSTFTDSFNLNAANLPTEESSYGLESLGNYLRSDTGNWSSSFALIKGFKRVGTGVSTSGNNTFYGNDISQRGMRSPTLTTLSPAEDPKGKFTNLNIGTSIKVINKKRFSTHLGLSGRYNNITSTVGGGAGLILSWNFFSVGFGATQEKVSNFYPRAYFISSLASVKVLLFELEYNFLENAGGPRLDPIHILTLSTSLGRFLFVAAARKLDYLQSGSLIQKHASVQILLSKHISVGYLYNYIPGANSLALQLFL